MSGIVHLTVHQFGPITDAEVEFDKYTVLIGEQGSGKSTIAKLYSMFTWMEKGLARGIISKNYITMHPRFKKTYCAYHRIETYFKEDTIIRFSGLHYNFSYVNETFCVEEKMLSDSYKVAKVMYIPAERNFLSTVEDKSGLKSLPKSLETLLEEFDQAKNAFKTGYRLPFTNADFEYDALNKIAWIKGTDYKIRLSAASSGFQSVLPLTLVTSFLSNLVLESTGKEDLTIKEKKQIEKEVNKVMDDESLTEEVKFATLRNISSRFKYSCFVNIVEEMEQNLYPESQMSVLFDLLNATNKIELNRLVLTTHSPYVINYLTLAAKAFLLNQKVSEDEALKDELNKVVPLESMVDPNKLRVYELKNGGVKLLSSYEGLPSDENFLNIQLGLTNELFDRLLEVEEKFDYKAN